MDALLDGHLLGREQVGHYTIVTEKAHEITGISFHSRPSSIRPAFLF